MKQPLLYASLFSALVLWSGCEEIPPDISFTCETDRKVLIEEFTGVQCVNCPTGSEKIEELHAQYGDQLIAVSIHSGFFSVPFADSPEDFTTADGEAIDAWAGPATGWPAAMINRQKFASESSRVLGLSSWAGRITEELCEEPIISVNVTATYDTASRQATITVNGAGLTSDVIGEKVGLTVLMTESNIIAPQKKEGVGKVPDYVHKHVLRDIISDTQGDDIHAGGSALGSYQKTYTYTLPAHWKSDECAVIAFAHYKTASNLKILQAAETKW